MSATNAERAVIEAARRVFSATGMRERVERLAVLRDAVQALELEVTAAAVDAPTMDAQFLAALSALPGSAGTRAYGVYRRYDKSPAELAAATVRDIVCRRGAGPAVLAAWRAALLHIGLTPVWAEAAGDEGTSHFLEVMRRAD